MNFSTLKLRQDGPVLNVTLSNPPLNLMSQRMVGELFQLGGHLMTDRSTRVVVLDSENPDFFIAHFDLDDVVRAATDPNANGQFPDINAVQSVGLLWQSIPQITIAKLTGRCRGGGVDFILALTMRFAALDARLCSPEAAGGFLSCGGGTTRITQMAGPARTLEYLLDSRDFSGEEAERYGLVNRALPAAQLDAYVTRLARSLADRSPEVVAMHREVVRQVLAFAENPTFAGFAAENAGLRAAGKGTEMGQKLKAMLELGQTREVELDLPASIERVNAKLAKG